MSDQKLNRPMGPLQEGDQSIIDALQQLPTMDSSIYQGPGETVITGFTGHRETTPGLPKDHWSIASLKTDQSGMPEQVEATLVTVSSKDTNVILRGGTMADELRTEEDKPKATERQKLHDRETEQSIKLLAAQRLNSAAETIAKIKGLSVMETPDTKK